MSAANALNRVAQAAVGLGAGASLLQASMYNVDGGYRAVMFDRLRGVQASAAAALTNLLMLSATASRAAC